MNASQIEAIHELFIRNPDGCETVDQLKARAFPEIGCPETVLLDWCGMLVGIESDGYQHT